VGNQYELQVTNPKIITGADSQDIVPIPNVTSGINSVVRSIAARGGLGKGDTVITLSISYGINF
jgi:hypothetical protein